MLTDKELEYVDFKDVHTEKAVHYTRTHRNLRMCRDEISVLKATVI
jgi:hypothetical protein